MTSSTEANKGSRPLWLSLFGNSFDVYILPLLPSWFVFFPLPLSPLCMRVSVCTHQGMSRVSCRSETTLSRQEDIFNRMSIQVLIIEEEEEEEEEGWTTTPFFWSIVWFFCNILAWILWRFTIYLSIYVSITDCSIYLHIFLSMEDSSTRTALALSIPQRLKCH